MTLQSRTTFAFLIGVCLIVVAGCATADQRVDVLYRETGFTAGGSGDLFLASELGTRTTGEEAIQWKLGSITNGAGEKVGNVVSDVSPADLAIDALKRELTAAGYHVIPAGSLPPGVGKGVLLNKFTLRLDEVRGFLNDDARCTLNLSVQPWRAGKALSSFTYEAEYSNSAITKRDLLASRSLQKALQLLMSQSVPGIVEVIEKR